MRRVLLIALVLSGAIAADAGACSCAGGESPQSRLDSSDAAFVGTVKSSRPGRSDPHGHGTVIHTFDVERAYKGPIGSTVDVEIGTDGGMCGFTPRSGERIGLLLYGGAPYSAGICNQIAPEDLERTRAAAPTPTGGASAFLVSGGFGVIGLDAKGAITRKSAGGGGALEVCPGAETVLQAGRELTVRRVSDLKVTGTRALPQETAGVKCLDEAGDDIVVARMVDTRLRSAPGLIRITAGKRTTLARGTQPYVAFAEKFALTIDGIQGNLRLMATPYDGSAPRSLGRFRELPHHLTISPDERRAAFIEYPFEGRIRLVRIDLRTGAVRRSALARRRYGPLLWLTPTKLVTGRKFSDAVVRGGKVWTVRGTGVYVDARRVQLLPQSPDQIEAVVPNASASACSMRDGRLAGP